MSYIVEVDDVAVGQVNHEVMSSAPRTAELDIWLRSEGDCGRGYGPDALGSFPALSLRHAASTSSSSGRPRATREPSRHTRKQASGGCLSPRNSRRSSAARVTMLTLS